MLRPSQSDHRTAVASPGNSAVLAGLMFAIVGSAGLQTSVSAQQQHTPISAEEEETGPLQPEIEDGVDYVVYDRNGNRSSLMAIVSSTVGDDVLLVGEEHDDMIGHAFETELFETVLSAIGSPSGSGRPVVLSMEMFERDVQYVVDEYLEDLISEDHFLRSSRPWDDYEARYRPLVEAAKRVGAAIVAANAPRRYVNRVSRDGPHALEDLSAHARGFLPPLPYPGPSDVYRAQWDALMSEAMAEMESDDEPSTDEEPSDPDEPEVEEPSAPEDRAGVYMSNSNVLYAQALWDAAMGHAITSALVEHIGGFVVHFAGSFHVEKGTGIPERIADYRPGTRVTSVVMTKVDDIEAWSAEDHGPLADFVVLTQKPDETDEG